MLSLQLMLAAAALVAGHAHAHARAHVGDINHSHQSRSTNAVNLVNYGHQLAKRQSTEDDASDGSFPPECAEQCNPYIQQGDQCAVNADGSMAREDDIIACSCKTEFFKSTVPCMLCAPSVFKDGAGYTVRDIISAAIESCKCMGYQIDDINLSALGEAEDESLGGGGTCYGGSSSRQAEPTEDNESSAGDVSGTMSSVTSTPQEDAFTSSKASATFIPASKTSTAEIANDSPGSSASSTSASGTGAASTIQAQQVLAFLVATAASAVSFSYIF